MELVFVVGMCGHTQKQREHTNRGYSKKQHAYVHAYHKELPHIRTLGQTCVLVSKVQGKTVLAHRPKGETSGVALLDRQFGHWRVFDESQSLSDYFWGVSVLR